MLNMAFMLAAYASNSSYSVDGARESQVVWMDVNQPSTNQSAAEADFPMLGGCQCMGGGIPVYTGESVATFGGNYGCIGGCGGGAFNFHKSGQLVKTIDMWYGGDVDHGGVAAACWVLTDGTHTCVGHQQGTHCETYTFDTDNYETIWTMTMHGNGVGTRFGAMQFSTIDQNSVRRSWSCGNTHTAYDGTNVDGKMISGFFGQAGSDVDQLGVYLMEPECAVTKREITAMECVNKQGDDCLSTWTDGGQWSQVEQTCNACATQFSPTCTFTFDLSETHTVTMSSTTIDQIGGSVEMSNEFSESFLGLETDKVTVKVGVTFSTSYEQSKSQSVSTTAQVGSSCQIPVDGGHAVKAVGNLHAGDMTADMKLTVTEYTTCGQSKDTVHDATVTLTNVAILAEVSQCTFVDVSCNTTRSDKSHQAESLVDSLKKRLQNHFD